MDQLEPDAEDLQRQAQAELFSTQKPFDYAGAEEGDQ